MHIENGSLLLIDEPETHLHPNFISLIISALHKILTATGSYSIISTHSVYIVREVPQDQVIILERGEKNNVVQNNRNDYIRCKLRFIIIIYIWRK